MLKQILLVAALLATPASAQLPGLRRYAPNQAAPVLNSIGALRADFSAQTGGAQIYFSFGSVDILPQARPLLGAQAAWLRTHPEVAARVEGYGDSTDTRDHALAVGARRAEQVRDYLVLMGVPPAQLTATSWGKERPGAPRVITVLVG
jgi:peptidoglycan-associated lipoprotein